jgi:hypothetical protein
VSETAADPTAICPEELRIKLRAFVDVGDLENYAIQFWGVDHILGQILR